MTPHKKLLLLSATACVLSASVAMAEDIPLGYYASLKGKCGAELKTAIHNLVSQNVKMLSYGSGTNNTWWGFYVTDYQMDGSKRKVIDRYSNDIRYYGSRGSAVSGMNIEHSFPKSWWGGTSNNAYKDLYNLMPCEQKINSSKSNYGMGVVTNVKTDNGCTKVGTGANSKKLWEPADKWKGEFARGYMYMATAYQDFTWSGEGLTSLENNNWPTLQKWAYDLYLQWAKADPVNQMEVERNAAVAQIQGNRNPYVDFPNLMEYVWGDSIAKPFDPATTIKSSTASGGGGDVVVPEAVYDESFTSGDGGCTTSGTAKVWETTTQYGWKASGYFSGSCTVSDASLTTPEIDLTGYKSAKMYFMHAANKFDSGKPEDDCSVEISVDGGQPRAVSGITWPTGNNWTFINSGDVDISAFAGHKIRVIFHYTSDTSVAGTWEIKSLKVMGVEKSGIEDIIVAPEDEDTDAPVELYSIDGRRLNAETARGLVIRRQGNKVTKLIIR